MAQFQSPHYNAVKGKVGGMVFQGGPHGPVMHPRTVPKQPNSETQMAVRNAFSAGSAAWKALGYPMQAGWSSIARQVSLRNSLGQRYCPTGRRLFMSCWQNCATAQTAGPSAAPPSLPRVGEPAGFAVTATPPGGAHPLGTVTLGGAFPLMGAALVLRASPPLSPDKGFLGPANFRVLAVVPEGGEPPTPEQLAALYAARFGPVQADTRIAFAACLTDADGFVGPNVVADIVVGA